ncbi:outer membrane beta-barrel protein [Compostibacter hankyongensis]|uniref:Outer membrane protein beta-barrel domain-containing protein n=1 Tax=Compostibacter hankyongensis TaxID=1007089 RepID=A0ABP8FCC2_9BACT
MTYSYSSTPVHRQHGFGFKFLVFAALFLSAGLCARAQDEPSPARTSSSHMRPSVGRYAHDFLMIQVTYDGWSGTPDSIRTGGFSRGFNIAMMYDFPLQKGSHLSAAAGLGVSTSNIFFKDQRADLNKLTPTLNFPTDSSYKRYKLGTAFLEIPIEIRYRQFPDNANRGFKVAIGAKLGALANAHTRGKIIGNGDKSVVKVNDKRFFNSWRAAATARIGWGNFGLYGSYTFTSLLKQGAGPTLNPYSIGLSISGL